jgi:hypothetical protein
LDQAEAASADHRENVRITAIGIRTIRLRLIDQKGDAGSPWHVADILNISHGGLCLMVGTLEPVTRGQALELDLRSHPDFGRQTLISEVRWHHGFGPFTTLGIAFLTPLQHLPRLELERRSVRRDEHG